MKLKYRKDEYKVLGTGEWEAKNEEACTTIYTGLWDGDKVIALLVAADEDASQETIEYYGDNIVRAVNSHGALVAALKDLIDGYSMGKVKNAHAALSLAEENQ